MSNERHLKNAAHMSQEDSEENPKRKKRKGPIPRKGKYTAEDYAEFFGRDVATIRRWIKEYRIPHFKPGDCIIVDAKLFWKAMPLIDFEGG